MKVYYTQDKIATDFKKFFKNIFSLSKPHLKLISSIIVGIISAESLKFLPMSFFLNTNLKLILLFLILPLTMDLGI